MKKLLSLVMIVAMLATLLVAVPTVSAQLTVECNKVVHVKTYDQLKNELEKSEKVNKTIVFDDHIKESDADKDYTITVQNEGTILVDMNGYNIAVNSKATDCLFSISKSTDLYFVNTDSIVRTHIDLFVSENPDGTRADIFYMDNYNASVTVYNVELCINSEEGNFKLIKNTALNSSVFRVDGGDVYLEGGVYADYFSNGSVLEYNQYSQSYNLEISGGAYLKSGYSPICFYDNAPQGISIYDCQLLVVDTMACSEPRINDMKGPGLTYGDVMGENCVTGVKSEAWDNKLNQKINPATNLEVIKSNISVISNAENQQKYSHIMTPVGHIVLNNQTNGFIKFESHSIVYDSSTEINASCTKDGKSADENCPNCGYYKAGDVIKAEGHTYEIEHYGYTQKKATTKSNGVFVNPCINEGCTKKITYTIDKIGTVKMKNSKVVYTGKALKPAVVVKNCKGKTISDVQYTVTYSNNKKIGTGTATVKFGSRDEDIPTQYSGTIKLTFQIVPKSTTVSKLTGGKKSIKVNLKKQTSNTTGYQIQYSTKSSFASPKTVTIKSNKTTAYTLKNLKAKTKYFVRVRTYKTVRKTKFCSSWSAAKNVKSK